MPFPPMHYQDATIYERAEKAGREAGERERAQPKQPNVQAELYSLWQPWFIIFMAKEMPGFEAAYRRFAVGFDERNKRWAEGNDD